MSNGRTNPTAPQNGGMQMFGGKGSKTLVQEIKKETGESSQNASGEGAFRDLWIIGGIIAGFYVILLIVALILRMFKPNNKNKAKEEKASKEDTPNLDADPMSDPMDETNPDQPEENDEWAGVSYEEIRVDSEREQAWKEDLSAINAEMEEEKTEEEKLEESEEKTEETEQQSEEKQLQREYSEEEDAEWDELFSKYEKPETDKETDKPD